MLSLKAATDLLAEKLPKMEVKTTEKGSHSPVYSLYKVIIYTRRASCSPPQEISPNWRENNKEASKNIKDKSERALG